MLVNWNKDLEAALAEAKAQNKPLLIDFSGAAGLEAHALGWKLSLTPIRKSPISFIRVLCRSKLTSKSIRCGSIARRALDADDSDNGLRGVERSRIEGYLPKNWFRARLEMVWPEWLSCRRNGPTPRRSMPLWLRAMRHRRGAEAIYWRGVSHYKATNDHTGLGEVGIELGAKYPDNEWTLKSLPWAH